MGRSRPSTFGVRSLAILVEQGLLPEVVQAALILGVLSSLCDALLAEQIGKVIVSRLAPAKRFYVYAKTRKKVAECPLGRMAGTSPPRPGFRKTLRPGMD